MDKFQWKKWFGGWIGQRFTVTLSWKYNTGAHVAQWNKTIMWLTSASSKQYLLGQVSTRDLTASATRLSTLTGLWQPGAKNSLNRKIYHCKLMFTYISHFRSSTKPGNIFSKLYLLILILRHILYLRHCMFFSVVRYKIEDYTAS